MVIIFLVSTLTSSSSPTVKNVFAAATPENEAGNILLLQKENQLAGNNAPLAALFPGFATFLTSNHDCAVGAQRDREAVRHHAEHDGPVAHEAVNDLLLLQLLNRWGCSFGVG